MAVCTKTFFDGFKLHKAGQESEIPKGFDRFFEAEKAKPGRKPNQDKEPADDKEPVKDSEK